MICIDCGGKYIDEVGDLTLENISIGSFTVQNVLFRKCDSCGELLFPLKTLKIIEAKEKEIKEYRLSQYPIADFIGATEAAEILGVSRQALHRNRRIRRGFIYSIRFGGKIAYLKKSVELYKKKRDGRFELGHFSPTEQPEYIKETIAQQIKPKFINYEKKSIGEQLVWDKGTESILLDPNSYFVQKQPGNSTIH